MDGDGGDFEGMDGLDMGGLGEGSMVGGDEQMYYGEGSVQGGPYEGSNVMYDEYADDGGDGEGDRPETNPEEDVQLPGVDDLPLFANPEARKIDLDIKAKEETIEETVVNIADMFERVKIMREHFKNVQQELEHTNALFNAKTAEINSEKHISQLTSRSLGRSQLEARNLVVGLESMQDQLNTVQTSIYRANERMDEFKMQMNWNQEELEQWAVAAKQKEEDNITLQKYTRADELKIKELSMQLEHYTKELVSQRRKLDEEVTETQAKQTELDRIAQEFKTAHTERKSLVDRWQETIAEIKRRDVEINGCGENFAVAKRQRGEKEALLATQQKRLVAQQGENRDVEGRAETLGRVVSRKREELTVGGQRLQQLRDELESLKNELSQAAENLVTKRSQNANLSGVNEEKRVQLERERQRYSAAKVKLETAKASTKSAEKTAVEAEQELAAKEREFSSMLARVKQLKDKQLKEAQTLHELKQEEIKFRADVHGSKSTSKNLEGQLGVLDKEAAKQQELLYNAEFQIQQIERKISRGMGERSDEEKRALKAMIDSAEERLAHARDKRKLLQGQCRKLQNELVSSRARKERLALDKGRLAEKSNELELENRMLEDEIKRDTRVKEDVVVAIDLMRLEVRRLRDLLSAKADAVFSLENRREQLLLSMEERKQEIAVHRDVLRAELRTSQDERHQATMDLRARESTVEKLKARFAVAARGPDEGHSQSYYVIKAAQKREEMQRRGDELDQDVRRCEREIRALQTTLDHLNARNNAYRNSFQKVDLLGDEGEVLKQLDERTKIGRDSLFKKKKELQRLVTDHEEDGRRLEQVRQQQQRVEAQRSQLENAKRQVEDEILSQEAVLSELGERVSKAVVKHRAKVSEKLGVAPSVFEASRGSLEEKAAKAEVLKDVCQVRCDVFLSPPLPLSPSLCLFLPSPNPPPLPQNVLYTLGQLASEFPEVGDDLQQRVLDANLRLPSKPPSRGGARRAASSASLGSRPGSSTGTALPQRSFDIAL
jgi:chromosome segregation ATPase